MNYYGPRFQVGHRLISNNNTYRIVYVSYDIRRQEWSYVVSSGIIVWDSDLVSQKNIANMALHTIKN